MCSFDIVSLYTNIPVSETIDIILDQLYANELSNYKGYSKKQFRKLLELALTDSYFRFDGKIYKQVEGLAMGSSLSPLVANIFLCNFEKKFFDTCPEEFKPQFYRRYLDDTFILFRNREESLSFSEYFNNKHSHIKFTVDEETNQKLAFLDVVVNRESNGFSTSIFRKATFSGLGTNYFSNISKRYKTSGIHSLIHRAFKISSSYVTFHEEVNFLRNYFKNNYYPTKIFNVIVRKFLNNLYNPKPRTTTVQKESAYLELPYIGYHTANMKTELESIISKYYPQINCKFYFRSYRKISSYFVRKDQPSLMMKSSVVYNYKCDCCQQSYIGSTALQMFIRASRHWGRSFRTNQLLCKPENSSIRDHSLNSDHPFKLNNFKILDSASSFNDLHILESLYIHRLKPEINNYQSSIALNIV